VGLKEDLKDRLALAGRYRVAARVALCAAELIRLGKLGKKCGTEFFRKGKLNRGIP
jgi:hypothetical protein